MTDSAYAPNFDNVISVQEFTYAAALTATGWQAWEKPRNCSWVYAVAVQAGAGGGGGASGASGSGARGGGGGGGSGAVARIWIPARFVPDVLYVFVGKGGLGGSAANPGNNGTQTFISTRLNDSSASGLMLTAGSTVAQAGGAGSASAGTGGSGGTAGTDINVHGIWGLLTFRAGQAGSAAGNVAGAAGVAVSWGANNTSLSGGAGGGSTPAADTNFAGGAITGASGFPTIPGGLAAGGAGRSGIMIDAPFSSCGGSGGGTNGATGVGGRGGDGNLGSGGGGGGGGVTGGAGGNGGNGYVLIVSG